MDIEKILTEGIVFKGSKSPSAKKEDKVKTKAKKKRILLDCMALDRLK